ncbi:DNA-processing protein DprA [Microbacterium sp. C7(2022)]|uniref:DNA-processing protein DprA n=1 Tax=Microbacterium sp. C7(2022) TaxID=2992759 RepID=UPI00237C2A38|nr:DNA-processing protein DprA [Microbacterium sp. C7(2022)]MDE0546911.1 DNA-processing protein DprA [Microbacterium sp. C7(2022)]
MNTREPFDRGFISRALTGLASAPRDAEEARQIVAHIVWSHLVEPGDSVAGRLVGACGAADALGIVIRQEAWPEGFTAKERKNALGRWHPRLSMTHVEQSLAVAQRVGISVLVPGSPEWPPGLSDLGDHAPLCIWGRGQVDTLIAPSVSLAVVGARAATSYGEHVAAEIAGELATDGTRIYSGGAYGIDGAAHRAALAVGGTTVAVLAGGVERAYPSGNESLLDRVRAQGAIIGEVPPGSTPTRWRFLQRNRLIAALSAATVVVEAGWRSGSLNTAGHAMALGRPLGAVPGPVTSATSVGCHRLMREYDALCVTGADDVRELLGVEVAAPATRPDSRTDDTTRVRDALSARTWYPTAEVARRAGMVQDDVETILGLLALEGTAEASLIGWRRGSGR